MRIVSQQTEEDIKRRETAEAIVFPLRELAANLLRIVGGAGNPVQLTRHMHAVIVSMAAYREAHGHFPPDYEISQALDPERAFFDYRPWITDRDLAKWIDQTLRYIPQGGGESKH